jgi:hypothetical protein
MGAAEGNGDAKSRFGMGDTGAQVVSRDGDVVDLEHLLEPVSSFRDAPPELGFTRVRFLRCPSRQQPTWMAQARNP